MATRNDRKSTCWQGRIIANGECWIWTGTLRPDGYGKFSGRQAHRVVYERVVGPIPAGLELDHLCRVITCVNPAHLEPVTRLENIRRRTAHQTACNKGHEFTPSNTYHRAGRRHCRACNRSAVKQYRGRRRDRRHDGS